MEFASLIRRQDLTDGVSLCLRQIDVFLVTRFTAIKDDAKLSVAAPLVIGPVIE